MSWILIVWFWDGTTHAQPVKLETFDSLVRCEMTLEHWKKDNPRSKKADGICIPARLD